MATTNLILPNLKRIRQQKALTQLEVARRAGTNINYYAKLERGEATPSLPMLRSLVKALRVHSSDLLPF